MPKFRKKPVEIEAIKWTGNNLKECFEFLCESYGGHMAERRLNGRNQIIIKTYEGNMAANVGDYLIKEPFDKIRGFYPCKPDIFNLTYDAMEE
jgi:predicted metalloenzyme YecM